jgi:hypothetical protein
MTRQERQRLATRASELVAALRLAVSASDDCGNSEATPQLLRLMASACRFAEALDRAVDEGVEA